MASDKDQTGVVMKDSIKLHIIRDLLIRKILRVRNKESSDNKIIEFTRKNETSRNRELQSMPGFNTMPSSRINSKNLLSISRKKMSSVN